LRKKEPGVPWLIGDAELATRDLRQLPQLAVPSSSNVAIRHENELIVNKFRELFWSSTNHACSACRPDAIKANIAMMGARNVPAISRKPAGGGCRQAGFAPRDWLKESRLRFVFPRQPLRGEEISQ
jgi:hypothetical protein